MGVIHGALTLGCRVLERIKMNLKCLGYEFEHDT